MDNLHQREYILIIMTINIKIIVSLTIRVFFFLIVFWTYSRNSAETFGIR